MKGEVNQIDYPVTASLVESHRRATVAQIAVKVSRIYGKWNIEFISVYLPVTRNHSVFVRLE